MNLKKIRNKKNFTVERLSKESGVAQRTIYKIEKDGDCKMSTGAKLATTLNVTLDELFFS